jgi:hypothetical protein
MNPDKLNPEQQELTLRISSDLAQSAINATSPGANGIDQLRLEDVEIAMLACRFAAKKIEDMIEHLNFK